MYIRKIAAAAGFACGAALAGAPLASADLSNDWWSSIDSLIAGASPAADVTPALNLAISFDGYTLLHDGTATATTDAGQFGLAIAYGDHATAYAAGGFGDNALASGTYALAEAGSKTAGATGFNFDSATDIGNNANIVGQGAPDGAYAGGGSLIGNTDAGVSANDTAQFIGNGGADTETMNPTFGNSGAFAGDSGLIGYNHVAGNGDTAYTAGNINGFGDGSAAVGGNSDSAYTNGTEVGTNEGAFSGFGNFNSASADTNYTLDGHGVSATFGDGNYALVYGPANSTAHAGGVADHLGSNNVSIVSDPFGTTADTANAGSSSTTAGSSDLAEVLYTHGNAAAQGGNNLYDILSLFGNAHSASLPAAATAAAEGAAAAPASTDPVASIFDSEVSAENSLFQFDALLAGDSNDITVATTPGVFDTFKTPADLLKDAPHLTSAADASHVTPLEYELYGVNPIAAEISTATGPFNEFNGALSEFYNAFNVEAYSLLGGTGTIPVGDLFGDPTALAHLLGEGTSTAVSSFLTTGFGDLEGFFGIFASGM